MRVRGFSELARMLNDHYGQGEDVSRQQVYQWWKRGTLNAAGQPFPREAATVPAPAHRPNREFDWDRVLAWAEPGIPSPYGDGWRKLGTLLLCARECRIVLRCLHQCRAPPGAPGRQ